MVLLFDAIYARQSLDKKDSISIESQIEFSKREIGDKPSRTYKDKGYSGKNTNRPDFERLIRDIEAGIIKKVWVYKLDRISRSVLDFCNMMLLFNKYGVEFVSCTEKFDTSTPMGKAMLSIAMVFAQLERETTQQRVKDNYYERGKRGFYTGGPVPYGLKKVKIKINNISTSEMVLDESQGPFLLEMYRLYGDTGMSLGQVSDYMNSKGVPSSNGVAWDSGKVSRLLRNPIYVKANADIYTYFKNRGCIISNELSEFSGIYSCFLYGKREANERKYTKVKDHVLSLSLSKGIVDSGLWLRCQYKLDENKQIKNTGRGKHTWLSGLMKCGYCGYSVSVTSSKGYEYLVCRGKTNLKVCDGFAKVLYAGDIEQVVAQELRAWAKRLKVIETETVIVDQIEADKLKTQIAALDNQIDTLINQLSAAGSSLIKYINQKVEAMDHQKQLLLEELNKQLINRLSEQPVNNILYCIDNWDENSFEQKKTVARYAITRILLKEDEINIEWRF